mmetsp:Transcript_8330/g.13220  ORF Transcript_8330/g.13220 Transcript_8330/m.13220 type:complete len:257 (-) Transcript_8330:1358-2128(-)
MLQMEPSEKQEEINKITKWYKGNSPKEFKPEVILNKESIDKYFQGYEGAENNSMKYGKLGNDTSKKFFIHTPKLKKEFDLLVAPICKVHVPHFHGKSATRVKVYICYNKGNLLWIKCECSRANTGLCSHGHAACIAIVEGFPDFKRKNNSKSMLDILKNPKYVEMKVCGRAFKLSKKRNFPRVEDLPKSKKRAMNGTKNFLPRAKQCIEGTERSATPQNFIYIIDDEETQEVNSPSITTIQNSSCYTDFKFQRCLA